MDTHCFREQHPYCDVPTVYRRRDDTIEEKPADAHTDAFYTYTRPKDREGTFKPRRQTNQAPDLSFLTSDTEAQSSDIKVQLSDLLKVVQAEEDNIEDEFALTDYERAQVELGLDLADDTDDPTANFAAMVGL
eukprot:gene5268-7047_t